MRKTVGLAATALLGVGACGGNGGNDAADTMADNMLNAVEANAAVGDASGEAKDPAGGNAAGPAKPDGAVDPIHEL